MANLEQIELELRAFLEEAGHLSKQDQFTHLKAIFDKHFAMEQTEHLMDIGDMRHMVTYAKSQFINTNLPLRISKKEVFPSEVPHVLLIEAVIVYLNRFKLLKRRTSFDYNK